MPSTSQHAYGVLGAPGDGGSVPLELRPELVPFVTVARFVNELSDGVLRVDGALTSVPLLLVLELLLLELPLSEPVPP